MTDRDIKNRQKLIDFWRATDTTGRTVIDPSRYSKLAMHCPLLLDGRASRLGVIIRLPDNPADPTEQIAIYDCEDYVEREFGWHELDDLVDEYNEEVAPDEQAEISDMAYLWFNSVDAAIKFADWINSTNATDLHAYLRN